MVTFGKQREIKVLKKARHKIFLRRQRQEQQLAARGISSMGPGWVILSGFHQAMEVIDRLLLDLGARLPKS
jgi:hypothetical protein